MKVTVLGHNNGVRIEIELPDDMSPDDRDDIRDQLQEIADMYDSAAELSRRFDEAARKLGLEIYREH